MTKFIVVTVAALLIGYLLLGNPSITLRSSDGKWADSEIRFKGRDFDTLVVYFEHYKLKCAPRATLFRATPEIWFNIFAWPSYYLDHKWRAPYSDAHLEIGDYFPPAWQRTCANESWSKEDFTAARTSADRYFLGL